MERHTAEVTLLESFDLGKNTARNAGIEIKVFGKGNSKKKGPQIGTIRIGQGSFAWWAKSAKVETKTGKRLPTVRMGWAEFADRMQELTQKSQKVSTRKAHAKAVAAVARALSV